METAGKSREYHATYRVRVRNIFHDKNRIGIAVPIPPATDYQEIIESPSFSTPPDAISEDDRFGNCYAVWQRELRPGEETVLEEVFGVRVSPRLVEEVERRAAGSYDRARRENPVLFEGTPHLALDDPRIHEIAEQIADHATGSDPYSLLQAINEYVVSRLEYGDPITGLYSSLDALHRDKVDCGGFDTLFASLALALKIPARILSGFFAGEDENSMHAWVEAMLPDNTWVPADPSVEHLRRAGRSHRVGRLGYVGSDRVVLSHGSDVVVWIGKKRVECDILQHPCIYKEQGEGSVSIMTTFHTK